MSKGAELYLGVDVGGTKILAGVVDSAGEVLRRKRISTPRDGGADETVEAIFASIEGVLGKAGFSIEQIKSIGVAVPGQIDPDRGFVINTPNMSLTQVALAEGISKEFGPPCFLGNDVRAGTLGEGVRRQADLAQRPEQVAARFDLPGRRVAFVKDERAHADNPAVFNGNPHRAALPAVDILLFGRSCVSAHQRIPVLFEQGRMIYPGCPPCSPIDTGPPVKL